MVDKKILLKEFILNNPSLKASEIYNRTKGTSLGTRKTEVLKTVREVRKLPEPTKAKREKSIPIKHRVVKPKVSKPKPTKQLKLPVKIPYEQTKFGKIAIRMEKEHGISEKNAIVRARAILKIPRSDYSKLNQKDVNIILSESP